MSSARELMIVGVFCLLVSVQSEDATEVGVKEHNKYRSIHSSPPVRASNDLNEYAQNWANHLAKDDEFKHSGGPYGENLWKSWGGTTDKNEIMKNAVKSWYDENKKYDYNNPGFSMETGHFTQVVWKASNEIGVGIATYPDQKWGHRTVVCVSYRPPGNYGGQYIENVLPPRK